MNKNLEGLKTDINKVDINEVKLVAMISGETAVGIGIGTLAAVGTAKVLSGAGTVIKVAACVAAAGFAAGPWLSMAGDDIEFLEEYRKAHRGSLNCDNEFDDDFDEDFFEDEEDQQAAKAPEEVVPGVVEEEEKIENGEEKPEYYPELKN